MEHLVANIWLQVFKISSALIYFDDTVSRRNQVHSVRKQVELRLRQPVVQVFAKITQTIFFLGGFEVWNTSNEDPHELIFHKV